MRATSLVAALERLGVDELLDELGRLGADDVAAEQLAVLLVADDLDQAGAVAVDRAGADGAVLDLADDDVVAGLAGLRLGEAERATFGVQNVARGMSGYSIGCVVLAGGVLDGDDALVGGLVRERGAGDEVADRLDALAARAQRAVDLDQAAARSSSTPASSRPRPSTSGPRPAAMTSQSTSPLSPP